jgi:hypothetical protein
MVLRRRRALLLLAFVTLIAALVYLRDPPWLLTHTYGLDDWHTLPDGRRARWTAARASFHVPADVKTITLPLRSLKQYKEDWPITAIVLVDDRPAAQLTFHHEEWYQVPVRIPPAGSRRARRIDIKLDRLREDGRAIELGEVAFYR